MAFWKGKIKVDNLFTLSQCMKIAGKCRRHFWVGFWDIKRAHDNEKREKAIGKFRERGPWWETYLAAEEVIYGQCGNGNMGAPHYSTGSITKRAPIGMSAFLCAPLDQFTGTRDGTEAKWARA